MWSCDRWYDPRDPDVLGGWGQALLRPAGTDADELDARQEANDLADATPGVQVYPVRTGGYPVQASIDLPGDGTQVVTGYTWRELLGKLTKALRAPG